jgi:hypothetical protein
MRDEHPFCPGHGWYRIDSTGLVGVLCLAHVPVRTGLGADNEVGHLSWLVDLDEVPGVVQQVQFAMPEQRG